MSINITYRRVRLDDAEEMQKIAAIDMNIPALFDPLFEVNEKSVSERLQQLMKCKPTDFFDAAVLVKEGSEKIVGFHFMNQFITPHGLLAADIQTLWVDPDFRKQGIATQLKARGEIWARQNKLNHISTFVHGKNASMLSINKSLGYELVGYKLRKDLK